MDHFARPGDPLVMARDTGSLHRNFQGYTTHAEADLLGFGVSAISHIGTTFTQNYRELERWEDEIRSGRFPVFRGYIQTKDDVIRSAVIEGCFVSCDSYLQAHLPWNHSPRAPSAHFRVNARVRPGIGVKNEKG